MADNYKIVTDIDAGNSLAQFDKLIESITRIESAITKVSSKTISPKVENPNLANFFAACDKAEAKVIKVKSEIQAPSTMGGGLSSFLNSEKGKFGNVGKELGQSLQMGMQSQFGQMGGMMSSLAMAGGPAGAAIAVVTAASIGLGAAATQAAMKWEDMKTSIGRTTGLKGDNLEDLMSSLQDLRQEFGITGEAASSMVEQAGSIGVGQSKMAAGDLAGYKQEILDFTKATAILQGAWGMGAEATSSGVGKMGSVTLGSWNIQRKARGEEEMSWADYAYKVGGTVDNLANAMGSSEEEIVTAMRNSSGAIAKWAPSEDTYGKWQAMASFLVDTGDSAGEAGTKIERVSQKMEQNGAEVAALMGTDQTGLNSKLKTDFMGTVQDLGKSIASMPASKRPDLFKMFGLEGASLMGKIIADVEAGTGKLQSAFDLALKPGNVQAGYEDVADNASKAFERIGQAAQVSLERIGGQLLPIVTGIANSIADAWVSGNAIGTAAFTSVASSWGNADKILASGGGMTDSLLAMFGGDVSEENLKKIEAFEKQRAEREEKRTKDAEAARKAEEARQHAEYEKTTQYAVGQKALNGESFAGASFKDLGTKSGIGYVDALNAELNTALPKTFTDSYLKLYDVAGRAAKELAKSNGGLFGEEWEKAFADATSKGMGQDASGNWRSWDSVATGGGTSTTNKGNVVTVSGGREYDAASAFRTGSISNILGNKLQWSQWEANAKDAQNRVKIDIIENGKKIGEEFVKATWGTFGEGEFEKQIAEITRKYKEAFSSIPRYIEGIRDETGGLIESILSDGVTDWEERGQIKAELERLKDFELKFPVEFDKSELPKLQDELEKLGKDIKIRIDLDKEEFAIDAAQYRQQNADLYKKMFEYGTSFSTTGPKVGLAPIVATKQSEDEYYTFIKLLRESQNRDENRAAEELANMDTTLATGNAEQLSVLQSQVDYVSKLHPELATMSGFLERIALGDRERDLQWTTTPAGAVPIVTNTQETAKNTGLALLYFKDGMGTKNSLTQTIINNYAEAQSKQVGMNSPYYGVSQPSYGVYNPPAFRGVGMSSPYYTFANGGLTNGPEFFMDRGQLAVRGEESPELILPLSDRQRTNELLMAYLPGLRRYARGGSSLTPAGEDLGNFGKNSYLSEGSITRLTDNLGACAGSCELNARAVQEETGSVDYLTMQLDGTTKSLETFNAIGTKQLQTSANWLTSSPYKSTGSAKSGSIDNGWLGYNANDEQFYRTAPDWVTKDIQMGRTSKEKYTQYKSEYDAATKEIARMNEELVKAKENYLDCWDVSSDYSRWLWQPEQQAALFQGDFVGSSSTYGNWVSGGKKGNVGYSGNAAVLGGFQGNEAGRLFRENKDVSGIVSESAFGKLITNPIVAALEYTTAKISGTIEDNGIVNFGNGGLDILEQGIFETSSILESINNLPQLAGNVPGALVGGMGSGNAMPSKWYLTEFDQYVASAENGLASCIEYMSDFAISQEGVMASDLFKPGYIGGTAGYAGAGKGAKSGYEYMNYENTFPLAGPYMAEGMSRGLPGIGSGAANYDMMVEAQTKANETNAKTAAGTQTANKIATDQLGVQQGILNESVASNILSAATILGMNGGGWSGSSGSGLVGGSVGGGDWFSASQSRYGSTFGNDWVSGGAAGVGQFKNEPSWGGVAASNYAAGKGFEGIYIGDKPDYRGPSNAGNQNGGSWGGWSPAFANEAYVSSPTVALIGDRPGGEYVIGADRFEQTASKMGRGGVTVNITQNINGSGLSASELESVLERSNAALMNDVNEKISIAAKGL